MKIWAIALLIAGILSIGNVVHRVANYDLQGRGETAEEQRMSYAIGAAMIPMAFFIASAVCWKKHKEEIEAEQGDDFE